MDQRLRKSVADPGVGQRERPSQRVAATIGKRIISGELRPGDLLPAEMAILSEFAVSRSVLREVFRTLAAKGLIQSRPKVGTRVRQREDWSLLDQDVLDWHLSQGPSSEVLEALFEVREIVEPAAAATAASRATPESIAVLEAALVGIESEAIGSDAQIEHDVRFHLAILDMTGNPFLRSIGTLIDSSLEAAFSLSWQAGIDDAAMVMHRAVFEAIRNRNSDDAFLASRRLIKDSLAAVTGMALARRSATVVPYLNEMLQV